MTIQSLIPVLASAVRYAKRDSDESRICTCKWQFSPWLVAKRAQDCVWRRIDGCISEAKSLDARLHHMQHRCLRNVVSQGPDGGVVTQRTANPCTPVRFRLGPPSRFLYRMVGYLAGMAPVSASSWFKICNLMVPVPCKQGNLACNGHSLRAIFRHDGFNRELTGIASFPAVQQPD